MSGRIRTVKPEWLEDELMAGASDAAARLSIALILMADDYGNGRASLAFIAGSVWGREMERDDGANAPEVLRKVSGALRELVEMRFVVLYEADRQRYFAIRNWNKHQKISHKGAARVPAPPATEKPNVISDAGVSPETLRNSSAAPPEVLLPDLRSPISEKDHRSKTTTASGARATAPEGLGDLGREVGALQRAIKAALGDRGAPADITSANWTEVATWARSMVTEARSLEAVHAQLARGFASDPKAAKAGWSSRYLAKNPNEYFTATIGESGVRRHGYVTPADAHEHVATTDEEFNLALRGGA